MIYKETIHKVLSSLWKNDTAVGTVDYNQALLDVQTAFDSLSEEPISKNCYLEEAAKRYATHYDKNFNGTNDGYIAENEKEAYIAGAKDVLEKIESLIKSTNGDDEVYHYNLYIGLQKLVKELKGE